MITNKQWIYARMRNLLAAKNYNVPIHDIKFEYDSNHPFYSIDRKITGVYLEVHSAGHHEQLIDAGFTYLRDGYFSKIYAFPKGMLD